MLAIVRKLQRKLKVADTLERCGFVLLDGTCRETVNAHPEPERAFMFQAKDLVGNEDRLLGTWHTHPGQPAALSQQDYAGFCQWPSLCHFIVGTDGVRAYRVTDGLVQEVDLATD